MGGLKAPNIGDIIVVKYMYLRDPSFHKNRTMTIARKRISDTQVEIAYCINRIEKEQVAWRDTGYVPKEHEYDAFSKKKGRKIAEARLEKGNPEDETLPRRTFIVTREDEGRFDEAILKFLRDDSPHYFAKKLGKHYLHMREIVDLARS